MVSSSKKDPRRKAGVLFVPSGTKGVYPALVGLRQIGVCGVSLWPCPRALQKSAKTSSSVNVWSSPLRMPLVPLSGPLRSCTALALAVATSLPRLILRLLLGFGLGAFLGVFGKNPPDLECQRMPCSFVFDHTPEEMRVELLM